MRKTRHSKEHLRIITVLLLVILMAFSVLPLSTFALEVEQKEELKLVTNDKQESNADGDDAGADTSDITGDSTSDSTGDSTSDSTSDSASDSTGDSTSDSTNDHTDGQSSGDNTGNQTDGVETREQSDPQTIIEDDLLSKSESDKLEGLEDGENEALQQDLRSSNPQSEEKAITLYMDGEKSENIFGSYDSLQEARDAMKDKYDIETRGGTYTLHNFIIQVNEDTEVTSVLEFISPVGHLTIRSKDRDNPQTITANDVINVSTLLDVEIKDIIIDGQGASRLLWVGSDPDKDQFTHLVLDNVTLQNGKAVTSDKVNYDDDGPGGALHCKMQSTVTIKNSRIINNKADSGAAIYSEQDCKITIENTAISNNNADSGAAIYCEGGDLQIRNSSITNNQAKFGGAIYCSKSAQVTINDGTIISDNTVEEAGAIYCGGNAQVTVNSGTINSNQASYGGAIFCSEGDILIKGGSIQENTAKFGGAVYFTGNGQLTLSGGEIAGNKVIDKDGSGGGIYLWGGKAQITGGTIKGNKADAGGAIAASGPSSVEITGGNINDNTADYAGGGIYLSGNSVVRFSGGLISENQGRYGGGVVTLSNSHFIMEGTGVISANQAELGGGIYVWEDTSTCDLISGTIEKNQATYGGGIRVSSPKTVIGRVVIQENVAFSGGGIFSSISGADDITIDGVQLINNKALSSGGGICLPQGASLNLKNSQLDGNSACFGGGVWTSIPMKFENCSFTGNEAIKSEIIKDGKPINSGHGGGIYVHTTLDEKGVVTVDHCTFKQNRAIESGGAISVDETHGLLKVINQTTFDGNTAYGEWGHGGAIYSNLHAYYPKYDDETQGPRDPAPKPKDFYINISTDASTIFKNNKAFRTFTPPSTKDEFNNLLRESTSHPGTKYDHPLNNDDVNLIVFKQVIFDLNYEIANPTHAAFLILEKNTFDQAFPENPQRTGYTFQGWNTEKDGTGTTYTADMLVGAVIEDDITLYAQWKPAGEPPAPQPPAGELPKPMEPLPKLSIASPLVSKQITGGKAATPEVFSFRLEALSYEPPLGRPDLASKQVSIPMPPESVLGIKDVTITGEGTGAFGQMTYEEPGTYTYRIVEIQGGNTNYQYSKDVYTFTDYVYEVDGQLQVRRTIYKNGAEANTTTAYFTNHYLGQITREALESLPATGSRDTILPGLGLVALSLALLRKKR